MDTAVWFIRERFQDKGGSSARELEELGSVWSENEKRLNVIRSATDWREEEVSLYGGR
jgi:hypothetical protein